MYAREIVPGVFWMGAQDFDRRLFEQLIPLPDGTSYNAYLVQGSEKTALIDAVDPTKIDFLIAQLKAVPHIDYLIVQHVEQDHTGSVSHILGLYPEAKVVTSPKAQSMLIDHLHLDPEKITTVADGELLSLGDRTLKFIHTPWVHWPETMLTYLQEDKILFTCDLFGAHLATTELYGKNKARVYEAAKRYYAEIMMPFHAIIKKHLEKLDNYEFNLIAPSHGPLYDDPGFILDAYRSWVNDRPQNLVLIPYVSMHGSTSVMVEHLTAALTDRGVRVKPYNMTVTDLGTYAIDLVDAATVIFATPTFLVGPHPTIVHTAYLTAILRPKLRYAAVINSYGWGGTAVKQIMDITKNLKVEWFDPVMTKGLPGEATRAELDRLAETIAEKHQEI